MVKRSVHKWRRHVIASAAMCGFSFRKYMHPDRRWEFAWFVCWPDGGPIIEPINGARTAVRPKPFSFQWEAAVYALRMVGVHAGDLQPPRTKRTSRGAA